VIHKLFGEQQEQTEKGHVMKRKAPRAVKKIKPLTKGDGSARDEPPPRSAGFPIRLARHDEPQNSPVYPWSRPYPPDRGPGGIPARSREAASAITLYMREVGEVALLTRRGSQAGRRIKPGDKVAGNT
jgi:hypothetical protein